MLAQALLLAATLLAPVPGASATIPTPQFRHYGVADGLPSSNVYTVEQDPDGFVWMGTRAGLVRFDGTRFRVFRHDPRDPDSISSNDVSSVLVDRRGRLWAGGEGGGLNRYDPDTGRFLHWRHRDGDPESLGGDDVGALAEGADGSLWISVFAAGLDRMLASGHLEHFRHRRDDPRSLASDVVLCVRPTASGGVWVGTVAGLDHWRPGKGFEHVRFAGRTRPPRVWSMQGPDDDLLLGTSDGLYRVGADGVARAIGPQALRGIMVLSIARGAKGVLWLGTREGLYWVGADGRSRLFPRRPAMPGGFPGKLVWKVLVDREGGVWAATQDGGVAYLGPDWHEFTAFAHIPDDDDSLSQSRTLAVAARGERLLVGGSNGQLDVLDPATGGVEHIRGLGPGGVVGIGVVDADRLWLARSDGLDFYDHGSVTRVRSPQLAGGVNRVDVDADGNAYVARPVGGVLRVALRDFAVTPVATAGEDDAETNQMGYHDGVLWRAGARYFSRLDVAGRRFRPLPGVTPGRILGFAFDDRGVWLARPRGLEHYRMVDRGRAVRDRFVGVDKGWPAMQVQMMMVDARGRVWLTSQVGLWRFDPDRGDFRLFGAEDGLPSPEFTSFELARAADGTVYTGTLRGVLGWRPDSQRDHPRRPPLALGAITVRRAGHIERLSATADGLDLHWNDRELRVEARALSFIDPSRNHYRFRMAGFDTDWVDTGTHGEREFAGLGHGDYLLMVQAAGPSGAWTTLSPLHVHVAAPPWLRPWAWLAYVLTVLLLGWAVAAAWRRRIEHRHRMQMAEQQRAMAEQANAAKTQFLATLGHEIRTPMTGVLGMAELLLRSPLQDRQRGYAEAIQRSGALLLKLVNDALDLARIEAGRLDLELAPLDPRALVREVAQLEAGLTERKGLELRVRIADDAPARVLGDALRIKQILLNLVNNALKFTERGHVELGLERDDGGLVFRVADTGPGIPEASRARLFERYEQEDGPQRRTGSGLGLAICRELVVLMGGKVSLESAIAAGSTFSVWLPLQEIGDDARDEAVAPAPAARRRVLLVEDDVTVAEVVCGLLEAHGHAVVHALNGLAALTELERGGFDVVLLDLDLPGVDGFRLAQMVRGREQGARLPIVAVTARSGGDEEQRAREAGMDGFLRKPLTGGQLQAELQRLLG